MCPELVVRCPFKDGADCTPVSWNCCHAGLCAAGGRSRTQFLSHCSNRHSSALRQSAEATGKKTPFSEKYSQWSAERWGFCRGEVGEPFPGVSSSFLPLTPLALPLMATGLPRHLAAASIVPTFTDIYPNSRLKSTFKCKFGLLFA